MRRDGRLLRSLYTDTGLWHIELSSLHAVLADCFDYVYGPVATPRSCTFHAGLQNLQRKVSKGTLLHWSILKGIAILPVPFHSYADRYQISRFMHSDGRLLRSLYTDRSLWHIELSNRSFHAMLADRFD